MTGTTATPMTPLARSALRQLARDAASVTRRDPDAPVALRDVVDLPAPRPARRSPVFRDGSRGPVRDAMARQAGPASPVVAAANATRATPSGAPDCAGLDPAHGFPPGTRGAVSGMRRVIAERLSASKRDAPHYYMSTEVLADPLLAMRNDMNRVLDGAPGLSVNDLVLLLTARCLARHGALNAAWAGDAVVHFEHVNLAVAVAVDGGLVTPVLRHADAMGLVELHRAMGALIDRARRRALPREAFQGGTFTVSNLGMYPVSQFAAIVNPPQAAILAVAAAGRRVVPLDDDRSAVRRVMTLTLSVDHRVADGVAGAGFLGDLKALLEEPRRALL